MSAIVAYTVIGIAGLFAAWLSKDIGGDRKKLRKTITIILSLGAIVWPLSYWVLAQVSRATGTEIYMVEMGFFQFSMLLFGYTLVLPAITYLSERYL